MLAAIATILLVLVGYFMTEPDNLWPAVICGVLIVIVWILHSMTMADARAYVNRTNYWANKGRDG